MPFLVGPDRGTRPCRQPVAGHRVGRIADDHPWGRGIAWARGAARMKSAGRSPRCRRTSQSSAKFSLTRRCAADRPPGAGAQRASAVAARWWHGFCPGC